MNADRRRKIRAIVDRLTPIQDELGILSREIDAVLAEEQKCFDSMPGALQTAEPGRRAEEAIDNLERAGDALDALFEEDPADLLEQAAA